MGFCLGIEPASSASARKLTAENLITHKYYHCNVVYSSRTRVANFFDLRLDSDLTWDLVFCRLRLASDLSLKVLLLQPNTPRERKTE